MYSRNVGRRANLSLGFRRLSTGNGTRIDHQEISNWSVHGNVTWRPTPSLMISLTELFSDAKRSLNGGLTRTSALSPLSQAHQVNNTLWAEQTLRHDATLAASWIVGGRSVTGLDTVLAGGSASRRLDSAIRIDAATYVSFGRRQIEVGDSVIDFSGGLLRTERLHAGLRAGLWVPLAFARLEVNAVAEMLGSRDRDDPSHQFDFGRRHVGAMIELPVGELMALRGTARLSRGSEGEIGGGAAEFVARPTSRWSASVGARVQRHECPCEDPLRLIDSLSSLRYDAHRTSLMGEASVAYQDSSTLVALTAYLRRSKSVVTTTGAEDVTISGGEARFRIPFWILALEGHAHGLLLPENDSRAPQLRAFGDLYAPLRLVDGNLELRVGTTLEYQSRFAGALYDDVSGAFRYSTDASTPTIQQYPLWDVYAHARIGTAYLRIALRNILGVEAWTVYRYPERGRSLVFEATWSFID
ncbi:MAG: hypothetical protein H7X80_11645 [bacterium]|nr:hypothetical protein [Candidatus Kapabacteria bacterium]